MSQSLLKVFSRLVSEDLAISAGINRVPKAAAEEPGASPPVQRYTGRPPDTSNLCTRGASHVDSIGRQGRRSEGS
jgi:hypothetical protein